MKRIKYILFAFLSVLLLLLTFIYEFGYALSIDSIKFAGWWTNIFPMIGFALINFALILFVSVKVGLSNNDSTFLLVTFLILRIAFVAINITLIEGLPLKYGILFTSMTIACLSGPATAKVIAIRKK